MQNSLHPNKQSGVQTQMVRERCVSGSPWPVIHTQPLCKREELCSDTQRIKIYMGCFDGEAEGSKYYTETKRGGGKEKERERESQRTRKRHQESDREKEISKPQMLIFESYDFDAQLLNLFSKCVSLHFFGFFNAHFGHFICILFHTAFFIQYP